jgi:flagellar biosynthesis GTPase FlhF
MGTKSSYASPLEQAIHEARQAEGAQPVLATSRIISSRLNSLGSGETFVRRPPVDATSNLMVLREERRGVQLAVKVSAAQPPASLDALTDQACRELASAGMSDTLARDIAGRAGDAWRAMPALERFVDAASFRRALVKSIVGELAFAPAVSNQLDSPAVLVFTGPPGAGKTTTLSKIATRQFLSERVPVRVISVDPHHAACHEKMRALAGMIGTAFTAANEVSELRDAIAAFSGKGALLIDTPGYTGVESEAARELACFLAALKSKETHLVLPAWMEKDDLVRLAVQYAAFAPDYLLFTKLDETESYGALISAALETGKPLSFLANGQNIPDDIGVAGAETLFAALFYGRRIEADWAA